MPSPTYGAAGTYSTGGGGGSNIALVVPTGTAANSIILAYIYVEDDTAITGVPTGFTQKAFAENNTASNAHRLYVYWKRATGADSGSYTFTFAAAVSWRSGVAVRIEGAITTGDPFDTGTGAVQTAATTTNATAAPAVSLTTTAADTLLVYSASNFNGGATYTPPTSFTENLDTEEITIATLAKGAAGATGSLSATASASGAQCSVLGAILSVAPGGASALPVQARRSNVAVMRAATR